VPPQSWESLARLSTQRSGSWESTVGASKPPNSPSLVANSCRKCTKISGGGGRGELHGSAVSRRVGAASRLGRRSTPLVFSERTLPWTCNTAGHFQTFLPAFTSAAVHGKAMKQARSASGPPRKMSSRWPPMGRAKNPARSLGSTCPAQNSLIR
jgi:hypothetical protein